MNSSSPIDISPVWQTKFALLEKLCGGSTVDAMAIATSLNPQNGGEKLTNEEKFKFICWPAFFFGWIWYAYHGLYKKAGVLVGISLVLFILLSVLPSRASSGFGLVMMLYFSYAVGKMATADRYRQLKQNFNDWL